MKKVKPKFILSKSKIFERLNMLKEISDGVSYSWKTNPYVGKVLNENESTFMSVHSLRELKQVSHKKKVWYFGLAWDHEELDKLFELGIHHYVVDNTDDLNTLLNYIKEHEKKISLLLRMKLKENTIFTGKHYVFGMKVNVVKDLIKKLYGNPHIEKLGIHVHRKTQNVSEWSLKDEVAEALGDDILEKIDYMNIGGGLPGTYKNTNDKTLESIFSKIKALKEFVNSKGVKVIVEPGRFIASYAMKLCAQVVLVHEHTVFVNCSIFNGMLDTVVANVKLLVEGEKERGTKYTIKGCTPDSCDILRYAVYLDEPKRGDIITFLNCGAYTYTTDFCALEKIEVEVQD